ncbi:MAG: hypothetical protein HONBIEJF_02728 [Fimbriimonadaceae bacterium]|nr:hypothetical protein [Fimbriimonadaceae bacterium]
MEQIDGHSYELRTSLAVPYDLDHPIVGPVDDAISQVDLGAKVEEELFRTKAGFVALLNFPVHTLRDRLRQGQTWSRKDWAKSRLADRFRQRPDAVALQLQSDAYLHAGSYVAGVNLHTGSLVDPSGKPLFSNSKRLAVHWGVRDQITALYAERNPLPRQRALTAALERVVEGKVPQSVVDNPKARWSPESSRVFPSSVSPAYDCDARYVALLKVFHAELALDRNGAAEPNFIARCFDIYRQIPESEVEAMIVAILTSDLARTAAAHLRSKLGRRLEPFDIWYAAFGAPPPAEDELDKTVSSKYPNVKAFSSDLPRILGKLGFSRRRSHWLADQIVVEPSRGAGHALRPVRKGDRARLRTRFTAKGMDYKSFNIAIHELGHCVEGLFSLYEIDHWFLRSVPNDAYTEALAFLFQFRDLELLGQRQPPDELRQFWATYAICGSALVDLKVWRWLYANPTADATQLREAVVRISREVWNAYYVPVLKVKGSTILGCYSHLIANGLYLPDYVLGRVAAFQLSQVVKGRAFGQEFERVSKIGNLTPHAWMRQAVGSPLSIQPMLRAARRQLGR